MVPFPSRSSARKASSDMTIVHAMRSATPSPLRSKLTPRAASVSLNPLPSVSTNIGDPCCTHEHVVQLGTYPIGQSLRSQSAHHRVSHIQYVIPLPGSV